MSDVGRNKQQAKKDQAKRDADNRELRAIAQRERDAKRKRDKKEA